MRVGRMACTWFLSGWCAATLFWLWLAGRASVIMVALALLAPLCAAAETWLLPWAERELERRRRAMR